MGDAEMGGRGDGGTRRWGDAEMGDAEMGGRGDGETRRRGDAEMGGSEMARLVDGAMLMGPRVSVSPRLPVSASPYRGVSFLRFSTASR